MSHALISKAQRSVEGLPYSIKPHKSGVVLWEDMGCGSWAVIATFARRSDAEEFIFAKAPPVWGRD